MVNPPQRTSLHYICETAESAEAVGLRPTISWSRNLPEDCRLIGEHGGRRIAQQALIHEVVKILPAFDGGYFAVGRVYIPLNNLWGFSTGRVKLHMS